VAAFDHGSSLSVLRFSLLFTFFLSLNIFVLSPSLCSPVVSSRFEEISRLTSFLFKVGKREKNDVLYCLPFRFPSFHYDFSKIGGHKVKRKSQNQERKDHGRQMSEESSEE